jgi:hypothetical protein
MKNRLFSNIIIILAIVLQSSLYVLLWVIYVRTPNLIHEADFRAFYTAGKISADYGNGQVYNLKLEQQIQENVVGDNLSQEEILSYNHPPLLLPILRLIAAGDYNSAYILYCFVLLLISLGCLPFLYYVLKSIQWPNSIIWISLIGFVLFQPLFISILKGQDTALLLLGLVIWFTGLIRGNDRLAGLGLALTTIRPQISILLAFPHIFRKTKVFTWYCLGSAILILYSYLLVGHQGFLDYLQLLRLSGAGQGYGLNQSAMFNFTGLLIRSFPNISSSILDILKWGMYAISMLTMAFLWKRSSKISYPQIVALVLSSLFFSPHLHYHDLAVLLIPIFCVQIIWVDAGVITLKNANLFMLLISTILLICTIFDPLYYLIPNLLYVFLIAASFKPGLFSINTFQLSKK